MTSEQLLRDINQLDPSRYLELFGPLYEHSPWIAQGALAGRPFVSIGAFHAALTEVVRHADTAAKLALVRAHPQLAGAEAQAGALTSASNHEQNSAGLHQCSASELARLRDLNGRYLAKFGFPFVMAVKGRTRQEILDALELRLARTGQQELDQCLTEIDKIAWIRLSAMANAGQQG